VDLDRQTERGRGLAHAGLCDDEGLLMQRIEAGLLIPGRGEPVTDAVVILDGATIAYAERPARRRHTPQATA
jgi:hypothetical protein